MTRLKADGMTDHELALSRYVTGEDDREAFIANLKKLGFDRRDIAEQMMMAEEERAEVAAYEAHAAHYGSAS